MLFNTLDTWWREEGHRKSAHEGLDLLLYRTHARQMARLSQGTRIPVMADGLIRRIINDYLGKTVFVEHAPPRPDCTRVYSIYGHTVPNQEIQAGMTIRRGDVIATVAGPVSAPFPMAPHLHLSIAWTPEPLPCDQLTWDALGTSRRLTLLDPLKVIRHPHEILADQDPLCRGS